MFRKVIFLAALVVAAAVTLVGEFPASTEAAPPGVPDPVGVVRLPNGEARIYDAKQVAAVPGVRAESTSTGTAPQLHKTGRGQASPLSGGTLYVRLTRTFYFIGEQFICGKIVGEAWSTSAWVEVNEIGDVELDYVPVTGTDSTGWGHTADESACVWGPPLTLWHARVTGTDDLYNYAEANDWALLP